MIYVMSDIHGAYDKYIDILQKINFNENDTLYVLGDIIDRGPHSIKILFHMMEQKNIVPFFGNHDYEGYKVMKHLGEEVPLLDRISFLSTLKTWEGDGGDNTYMDFLKLSKDQKERLVKYFDSFQIYKEIVLNNKIYFLSHTVPSYVSEMLLNDRDTQDYLFGEPDYEKKYFDDVIIVTGHTPTGFIDENYKDRIYIKNNHIAVDCGAGYGGPLGCVCLDTMEEFYS